MGITKEVYSDQSAQIGLKNLEVINKYVTNHKIGNIHGIYTINSVT